MLNALPRRVSCIASPCWVPIYITNTLLNVPDPTSGISMISLPCYGTRCSQEMVNKDDFDLQASNPSQSTVVAVVEGVQSSTVNRINMLWSQSRYHASRTTLVRA